MSSGPRPPSRPKRKLTIIYTDEAGATVTEQYMDDKYEWRWGERSGILFVVSKDERIEKGYSSKFPFRFTIERVEPFVSTPP